MHFHTIVPRLSREVGRGFLCMFVSGDGRVHDFYIEWLSGACCINLFNNLGGDGYY